MSGTSALTKRRRRRFSVDEKRSLLEEAMCPGQSIATVARRYGISTSQLFSWRKALGASLTRSLFILEPPVPAAEVRALRARIRALERLLERKTQEHEVRQRAIATLQEVGRRRA